MTTRYNESSSSFSSSNSSDEEKFLRVSHDNPQEQNSLIHHNNVFQNSPTSGFSNGVLNRKIMMSDVDRPVVHFNDTGVDLQKSRNFNFSEKPGTGDLELSRKAYEYFNAPITKYWFNVFVYAIFIICFCRVVLLKTDENNIGATEVFVIIYIFTFAVENLRSLVFSTPRGVWAKIKNWHSTIWNSIETLGLIIFLIGLILRSLSIFESDQKNVFKLVSYSRMMYCIDLVIWLTRLFKFCCVHKTLGPYVTLTGKMLRDMSSFLVILIIVLFSFGVCRQAIYNTQNTEWSSSILWNITHEPYFMLYGEVYAFTIDPCTAENKALGMCVPGKDERSFFAIPNFFFIVFLIHF